MHAVLEADVPLINSILQPNADPQCVAFKDAFFSMPELQTALREQGHHDTALVIKIFGRADMAWDMSGLTHKGRLGRLLRLKQLLLTVLAPTFASVAQMRKSYVLGAPRNLLWAMLHSVDSYLLVAQRFPLLAEHAVARFWSQDDLGGMFASLCFLCGYRPGWETASARLVRSEVLAAMRRNPAMPFNLPISAKHSYKYHAASLAGAAANFNDGSKMDAAAQQNELDSRARDAAASLPEMKHPHCLPQGQEWRLSSWCCQLLLGTNFRERWGAQLKFGGVLGVGDPNVSFLGDGGGIVEVLEGGVERL